MNITKTVFAAFGLCASVASANPADVTRVSEGLITAGMAIELADQCGDVNVRLLRGISYLQGLKNHLKSLGYSDAQIDAYIDDDAQKDRLEAIARERLSDLGVRGGNAASYCSVARAQMQAGTPLGQLLR